MGASCGAGVLCAEFTRLRSPPGATRRRPCRLDRTSLIFLFCVGFLKRTAAKMKTRNCKIPKRPLFPLFIKTSTVTTGHGPLYFSRDFGPFAGDGVFHRLELLQELLPPGQGAGLAALGGRGARLGALARDARDFAGALGLRGQLAFPVCLCRGRFRVLAPLPLLFGGRESPGRLPIARASVRGQVGPFGWRRGWPLFVCWLVSLPASFVSCLVQERQFDLLVPAEAARLCLGGRGLLALGQLLGFASWGGLG